MRNPRLQTAGRLAWYLCALLVALAILVSGCNRSTATPVLPQPTAATEGNPSATEAGSQASPSAAEPSAASPTGEPPAVAAWTVEIVQNGAVLTEENAAVRLARAPFTLRMRLPALFPVKLNASTSDQNFQALQPGFVFTDDCLLALCTGMDVAEERLNPDQTLFVDPELTHYLYYQAPDDHRWSRVELTEPQALLERDVAKLNEIPIEQTADPMLFLLVYVDQSNIQQIDPGELKKMTLLFQ
jgi:hypothetical protein